MAVYSFISLCLGMTISRSPSDQTSWRAPCRTRRQPREHSLFSRSRRFMSRIYTYMCNCQDSSRVRLYPRFYVGEHLQSRAATGGRVDCWVIRSCCRKNAMVLRSASIASVPSNPCLAPGYITISPDCPRWRAKSTSAWPSQRGTTRSESPCSSSSGGRRVISDWRMLGIPP